MFKDLFLCVSLTFSIMPIVLERLLTIICLIKTSFANLQSSRAWESDFLQRTPLSSRYPEPNNAVPGTQEAPVHWMDEKTGKIPITGFGDNETKVFVLVLPIMVVVGFFVCFVLRVCFFFTSVILFSVISFHSTFCKMRMT